ncbi:hypothetical protein [Proteus sp. ZN5]|uniref:hypothetical protein n=1 Tax=Proteus sp. ZN5 TaxID=2697019 RepID=UPI0013E10127|nr:hypothetical protein [Proteus sp. ZN5]QIG05215.1 hypothetical protein GTK47_07670 [Proteus sp. ZN5]
MNKKATVSILKPLLLVSVFFFVGYVIVPPKNEGEQYAKMSEERFRLPDGSMSSVLALQQEYFDITGNKLAKPATMSCRWDSKCYFDIWLANYNSEIDRIKAKQLADKEQQEAHAELCSNDPECIARLEGISFATRQLNRGYSVLQSRYLHDQDGADALSRMVCRQMGKAQRDEKSKESVNEWVNSLEGIPPDAKPYVSAVGEACWSLSLYGVPDGTVRIEHY